MRGRWLWLALPALLVLLVLTLPAGLLVSRLDVPDGIGQVRGTVWSGQARWRQSGWQPLVLEWRWRGGRDWQWQAQGGATDLQGSLRPARTLTLPVVGGRLEMERLDLVHWLGLARPIGELELDLRDVVLADGEPPQAQGRILWRRAGLIGAVQESLGEIEILLDDQGENLNLQVRSLQPAPIQVRGQITLEADRYNADLWLRAERDRPGLTVALSDLGELQPDGQVRVRIAGATGL